MSCNEYAGTTPFQSKQFAEIPTIRRSRFQRDDPLPKTAIK